MLALICLLSKRRHSRRGRVVDFVAEGHGIVGGTFFAPSLTPAHVIRQALWGNTKSSGHVQRVPRFRHGHVRQLSKGRYDSLSQFYLGCSICAVATCFCAAFRIPRTAKLRRICAQPRPQYIHATRLPLPLGPHLTCSWWRTLASGKANST
jgi:hypothetical protein